MGHLQSKAQLGVEAVLGCSLFGPRGGERRPDVARPVETGAESLWDPSHWVTFGHVLS